MLHSNLCWSQVLAELGVERSSGGLKAVLVRQAGLTGVDSKSAAPRRSQRARAPNRLLLIERKEKQRSDELMRQVLFLHPLHMYRGLCYIRPH